MRRIIGYSMLVSLYFIIGIPLVLCFESRKEGFLVVTTGYLAALFLVLWVGIGTGLFMGETFAEMYQFFFVLFN